MEPLNRRMELEQAGQPVSGAKSAGDEDIALVFAPGAPVARALGAAYRPRRGQALMARLVKRALEQEQHALVEAGTGSGKSFAYLIPRYKHESTMGYTIPQAYHFRRYSRVCSKYKP